VPFLLRCGRRPRWYPNAAIEKSLLDLIPDEHQRLSAGYVEDDRSNFQWVVCALAATRINLSEFDYILIEYSIVASLNIPIERTRGRTPDEQANDAWHRDLYELDEQKHTALANAIRIHGTIGRIPPAQVTKWLVDGILAGSIDRQRMNLAGKDRQKMEDAIQARQANTSWRLPLHINNLPPYGTF
jgi:hypothetical protein